MLSELVSRLVHFTDQHVFLTGKAGTGKTTLLHEIAEKTHKRYAIVAPTGVAAIQAGGVTIHSFLGIHPHTFLPWGDVPANSSIPVETAYSLNRGLRMVQEKINLIKSIDLLIIDEISMVRCDLLDAIDTVLRKYRDPLKAFGGIQLLMIGDLFQLPPVVRDEDTRILSNCYPGFYFFESKALQKSNFLKVELSHVYRQNDPIFLNILNEIRFGQLSFEHQHLLENRIDPNIGYQKNSEFITLTTHVRKADDLNTSQLKLLPGKERSFEAHIDGEFQPNSYPTDATLRLKIGAQVMFLKNDKERRFFNGRIGIIEGFDLESDLILVRCKGDSEPISLGREKWRNVKYTFDQTKNSVQEDQKGSFEQFPLRLAWAITIHKSQGLTFDNVIIDAGSAFAPGQVYVAMSRCRTLEGIVLMNKLSSRDLQPDHAITQFSNLFDHVPTLSNNLMQYELNYLANKSYAAFDFSWLKPLIREAQESLIPLLKKLNDETAISIKKWEAFHPEITTTALNYKPRLEHLFHHLSINQYSEDEVNRFPKAVQYFCNELINKLVLPLQAVRIELTTQNGIKSAVSSIRLFEIRIREVIRQLIETELLFHAWFNRSEVQSIKGKLNERIQEINALIVSHSPTNNEQLNQKTTTKEPKKKKAKVEKGSTQRLSLQMMRSGKTIQEIALSRELKASTICSHLAGFIEQGELKLNEILSASITEKLETAMRDFPADKKLGETLSALSNQFAADEIVLGFAWKKYNSKNDTSN
jgi:hypothetical protein